MIPLTFNSINKTKDQLWSLNAAQPVGNILLKMDCSFRFKNYRLGTIGWFRNKANHPLVFHL